MSAKWINESALKELNFHEFDKSVHNITNTPITKEKMSFIGYHQIIYTATRNKTAIRDIIIDDYGIATYPHETNMSSIKYFNDK